MAPPVPTKRNHTLNKIVTPLVNHSSGAVNGVEKNPAENNEVPSDRKENNDCLSSPTRFSKRIREMGGTTVPSGSPSSKKQNYQYPSECCIFFYHIVLFCMRKVLTYSMV